MTGREWEPGHLPSMVDLQGMDSDGDGVLDAVELSIGTDPYSRDSDQDGIPDGEELRRYTNPRSRDTDRDGISDRDELAQGSDPLHAEESPLSQEEIQEIVLAATIFLSAADISHFEGDHYSLSQANGELFISHVNRGPLLNWNNGAMVLNHLTHEDRDVFSGLRQALSQDGAIAQNQKGVVKLSDDSRLVEID